MGGVGKGGDGLLLVHRLAQLAVLALLRPHLGRDLGDAASSVVRCTGGAIGVGDVVPREVRIGDGREPVEVVAVVDRLCLCLQVRRDLLGHVRGEVVLGLGLSRVGVVDHRAPAEVVVADARGVRQVVHHLGDLLQGVVAVGGPDDLGAGLVEFLDRGNQLAHIPIGALHRPLETRVDVGVGDDSLELQIRSEAARAEAVGDGGEAAIRDRGPRVAIQYVIGHCGRGDDGVVRDRVEGAVHYVTCLDFRGGIALRHRAPEAIERDLSGDDHLVLRGVGVALEHRRVLLGLDDALQAVGEEDRVDRVRLGNAVGVLVHVPRDRVGDRDGTAAFAHRATFGVVFEGESRRGLIQLIRPDDMVDAAHRVVEVGRLVAVGVDGRLDLAEGGVVGRPGGQEEAVGDARHVRRYIRVVLVGERIVLPGLVRRPPDLLQIAVAEVG